MQERFGIICCGTVLLYLLNSLHNHALPSLILPLTSSHIPLTPWRPCFSLPFLNNHRLPDLPTSAAPFYWLFAKIAVLAQSFDGSLQRPITCDVQWIPAQCINGDSLALGISSLSSSQQLPVLSPSRALVEFISVDFAMNIDGWLLFDLICCFDQMAMWATSTWQSTSLLMDCGPGHTP